MATTSLYQKYRPQNWSRFIGQDHIRKTLQNEIRSGNVTHAYIFTGPRGVGKTTAARLLAKSVNCTRRGEGANVSDEPCNECESCMDIMKSRALDMIEIDAASHTGVDNVRENIIENARVAPSKQKNKVFIIDEVHMLSTSAFNALLKIMEEPPTHTIFILATTEIHKVPETIISRCQRFDFRRVDIPSLLAVLQRSIEGENIEVDETVLLDIARRSEGCIRDAQSLLGQILSIGEKKITRDIADLIIPRFDNEMMLQFLQSIIEKDTSTGIDSIQKMAQDGMQLLEFMKNFIEFLRSVMLMKISEKNAIITNVDFYGEFSSQIKKATKNISTQEIAHFLELFIQKLQLMKQTDLHQLILEMTIVELTADKSKEEVKDHHAQQGARASHDQSEGVKNMSVQEKAVTHNSIEEKIVDHVGQIQTKEHVTESEVKRKKEATHAITQNIDQLNIVEAKWSDILKNIRKYNHSLNLTLKVAQLVSYKNNVLTLGFRYKFYRDRIAEPQHRVIIEQVMEEVIGQKIRVTCEIHEKFDITPRLEKADNIAPITEKEVSNVWDLAMNTFGEEVVKQPK